LGQATSQGIVPPRSLFETSDSGQSKIPVGGHLISLSADS